MERLPGGIIMAVLAGRAILKEWPTPMGEPVQSQ